MVPELWQVLDRRHLRGERYLADRGLSPAALRRCGDVVRFYPDGAPVVRVWNLDSGAPINIVRRQIDRDPKVLALDLAGVLGAEDVVGTFSTSGTLVSRITEI